MHMMVKQVPDQMRRFMGIIQFSGQGWISFINSVYMNMNYITIGVEKKNDDARRNYFSSNHHDPPKEILVSEYRLQTLAPFA